MEDEMMIDENYDDEFELPKFEACFDPEKDDEIKCVICMRAGGAMKALESKDKSKFKGCIKQKVKEKQKQFQHLFCANIVGQFN